MVSTPLSSEQTDVIIAGYTQFHSYLRNNESYEHRVSFGISGFFLTFGALVLRRQFGSISPPEALGMSIFIILAALCAHAFLISNVREMRTLCQRIVSFETAMGYYSQGSFLKDDTLLPVELNKWGLKCSKHNFNSWPYLVGVWVSMAVAIFSLLSNYSVDTKTPAPTPIEIRLHEHDRFDSQLSTTLNDTLQQLSKTVDRLVPVVNLLVEQQAQPQPPPRRRRPRAHPERGGS